MKTLLARHFALAWVGTKPQFETQAEAAMRSARILGPEERPANYYHVMSRAIEGRMIFDDLAKEKFRKLLEAHLQFAGIECVTFCLMGNHFHLLLHVPSGRESLRALDDAAFLKQLRMVHGARSVDEVGQLLARLREQGAAEAAEKLRERFFARMHDLSAFMRELKQRFYPGTTGLCGLAVAC